MEEQTLKFEEDTYKIVLKIGAKGQVTGEVAVKAPTLKDLESRAEQAMGILLGYTASYD